MRRSTKGFYTVEAALILPIVIIAVLTLGYFIKVEMVWENCMHGAIDETQKAASRAYDGISTAPLKGKVKSRIEEDNPGLNQVTVDSTLSGLVSADAGTDAFRVKASMKLVMPFELGRDFELDAGIKYRGFVGYKSRNGAMGREGLETGDVKNPVVVFPQAGERYHSESCTYVKATVSKTVLTENLRHKYDACGLCNSQEVALGSIVYCFKAEGEAYHRANCPSINRHTIVIDRDEAIEKGYTPCTKCGGS